MPQSANFAHILISFVAGFAFVFVCNIKNIFYASAGGCLRHTFFPSFLFFVLMPLYAHATPVCLLLLLSLRYSCFLHLCEIDRRAKEWRERAGRRINTHSPPSHTPWHSQVIIMRGMHIIIISIFMIIPVICHSCCLHLRFPGLGLLLSPAPLFRLPALPAN